MAKITIDELYRGDKYCIMGEVVKQVFARQKEFVADPHTFRENEIVRQTLIAAEKMKQNGDCVAEGELGDTVAISLSERSPAEINIGGEDFGAVLVCAVRYGMGRQTYMPSLITDFITPLLPYISDSALRCFERDLSEPAIYGGLGNEHIDAPKWVRFHADVEQEIETRKEQNDGKHS